MSRLAAHINDAGITVLDSERIIYREPGFALLEDGQLTIGNLAFARARINPRNIQHRFWAKLSSEPIADRRFPQLTFADLASRQLEQVIKVSGSRDPELILAVPCWMDVQSLGLLLGIAGELGIRVTGLVDSAVAATRREYRNAVPVHVDMSLHAAMLTRLAQSGNVQVEKAEVLDECGVYVLYEAWINTIAEAFVMQSRFDPLHTAETEQLLLNRLGGWLTQAAGHEQVELEIEYGGATYRAVIESLSLVAQAAPVYQQLASKLRALFRADELPAIQISDRVARMPGLAAMLKARVGGEIYVLEAGATARGALSRLRDRKNGGGVSLLRQLPWDQSPVEVVEETSVKARSGTPTHLLFGSKAYAIGNSPLDLGSQQVEGSRSIVLDSDMPGLSRRHCSLVLQNGQCLLQDHSRYGTFLNGHRISSSAALQVGDSVRIGSPGFEFLLITTDENHG
ncbi:MAG: FHA domain-containing protein [Gammaproteobacteria bacterium]|nr:FHA domain-containing protein [Gammaproteobacteria bacterium]